MSAAAAVIVTMQRVIVVGLLVLAGCISSRVAATDVTVTTRTGRVTGHLVAPDHDPAALPVQQFLGIPFAKPATGPRRFLPPEAIDSWSGTYQATRLPPACYQVEVPDTVLPDGMFREYLALNANISEDCLYLNIWVPDSSRQRRRSDPLPVMVWIYGGGYAMGSSTSKIYHGRVLASRGEVIVASMQYRVGALGFLYLGSDQAPGNMGLLDQQMALRWIKENVANFGGDPERITIFGESAGGGSVSFHLLAPSSWPHFTRAIIQSGPAQVPWGYQDTKVAKGGGIQRADGLGCGIKTGSPGDLAAAVRCMRGLHPLEITTGMLFGSEKPPPLGASFTPTTDGKFIPESPKQLLETGRFYKTDVLVGTCKDEGAMFLDVMLPHLMFTPSGLESNMNATSFRAALDLLFFHSNKWQRDAVAYQYQNWRQPQSSSEMKRGLSHALGDSWFACPTAHMVDTLSGYSSARGATYSTYTYQFAYRGSLTLAPQTWATGATHGDDITYVFGWPLVPTLNFSAQDRIMAETVITYWSNFADTGNPNSGGVTAIPPWSARTGEGREYLVLDSATPVMAADGPLTVQTCAFWDHYIPSLAGVSSRVECSRSADMRSDGAPRFPQLTSATHITRIITATVLVTTTLYSQT